MGIDVGAMLIYGLPYEDIHVIYLEQHPEEDIDFQDWIEELELVSASPYYDSSYSDRIFGVIVEQSGEYYCKTSLYKIDVAIQAAERDFEKLTGKYGKLYISPDVT